MKSEQMMDMLHKIREEHYRRTKKKLLGEVVRQMEENAISFLETRHIRLPQATLRRKAVAA